MSLPFQVVMEFRLLKVLHLLHLILHSQFSKLIKEIKTNTSTVITKKIRSPNQDMVLINIRKVADILKIGGDISVPKHQI